MNRLEIEVRLPRMQMTTSQARLHLEHQLPQMTIERENPAVHIDLTAPLAEMGLKRSTALARSVRDEARVKVMDAIGAIAHEGDMLRDVHLGVNVAQAVAERTTPPAPEVNIALMPVSRPRIEASGGMIMTVAPGSVRGRVDLGAIDIKVQAGTVRVALIREPKGTSVDIRV